MERRDAALVELVRQLPRRRDRRPPAVDRDRLADDDPDPGEAERPRESARAEPTIRTGTSGTPVASASRAAPRVQAPPRTVPCGKIATVSPAREQLVGAGERRRGPSRPRATGIAAERVHQPGAGAVRQSSSFARKRSGWSAASASSGGSSSDSWFAATTHGPGGTRPTISSR